MTDVLTKILRTAHDVYRKFGFKAITMDDVARHAGISKKTLYQHFENKNDLIHAVMKWHHELLMQQCNEVVETSKTALDAMVDITEIIDKELRLVNPIAVYELQRYYPEIYTMFNNHLMGDHTKMLRTIIERGVEEGIYRDNVNADILARYRMAACMMLYNPDSPIMDTYPMHVVNTAICDHFLHGILTAKGEKQYEKFKAKLQ